MTVSLSSSAASSIILEIVIVPLVAPALMVKVPFARVYSVPDPAAVPVTA